MPRKKKEIVFPNHIRVREPEREALGRLVEKAIGENRSLTEFAEVCGVSPSTISRVINGKFTTPISDKTILAIAENADPDSGVSLDDLLAVHGLAPISMEPAVISEMSSTEQETDDKISDEKPGLTVYYAVDKSNSMGSPDSGKLVVVDALDRIIHAQEFGSKSPKDFWNLGMHSASLKVHHDTKRVENLVGEAEKWVAAKNEILVIGVRNKLQSLLIEQGYSIQLHKDYNISTLPEFRYKTHFAFTTDAVADRGLEKWAFEVITDNKYSAVQKLSWIFGLSYLDSPYKAGTKVSLVLFDKEEFELVKVKFADVIIQDCVSIILVNKKFDIIEEYQIAQKGVRELPSVLTED